MGQIVNDSSVAKGDNASLENRTFSNHPQVRSNEAVIWNHLCELIANTIEYVSQQQPVHVIEIGGLSLQGLELLSQRAVFSRIKYTIVDEAPPYNHTLVDRLGAEYLQMSARDIPESKVGRVNFVVAMRALEYDQQYSKSLELFREWSSYPSYGIFVHNSEQSSAFDKVRKHQATLEFRLITLSLAKAVRNGDLSVELALQSARESSVSLLENNAARELAKFDRILSRIDQATPEQVARQIADKYDLYQAELKKIHNLYGERFDSRRFWSNTNMNDIGEFYSSSNVLLLQRENAYLRTSGLRVHIDTVDLYNAWTRDGRNIPQDLIPKPTSLDLVLD